MQVTDLKIESNMKEELLEAIYGTVERLEQKVDELSVHIPADTRSAFPVISVQSPVSIQCCWQS